MNVSPQRKAALILASLILLGGALLLVFPSVTPPAEHLANEPAQIAEAGEAGESSHSGDSIKTPKPAVAGDYGMMLLQMIVSVALVCLLAYAILRWGLGRVAGATSGSDQMQILSRLPIGPNRTIMVVRVGPRFLVVGNAETEISLLCELSEEDALDFFEPQAVEKKA